MKNTNRCLIAVAALALLASAGQASAGHNDSCCDRAITASPKVRAMLNDEKARCCGPAAHVTQVQVETRPAFGVSPKVQQTLRDRAPAPAPVIAPVTAAYKATGADGITASPKVRAVLNERPHNVEIAPLK